MTTAERESLRHMGRQFAIRGRRASEARRLEIERRHAAALILIKELIAQFRATDPDIRKIVLFGSLVSDMPTNPEFDIDIAVDSDRYWELLGIALDADFPVDLIDLPRVASHIGARVVEEGMVLYERT